jgi:hypothetical protein
MTVLTGLANLYAGGYDISGDVAAISGANGGPNLLDASTIDTVGFKRIAGRFDGSLAASVLYNPTGAHIPLSALPTTLVPLMLALPGTTAGDYAAMLVGKYVDYAPAFSNDLAVAFAVQAQASEGFPLEWGSMITAGKRTDGSATASGTGIDLGVPAGVAAVTITSSSIASPTVITTAAPHLLQTGDSVVISGHTSVTPALDGSYTVTVTGASTFTVPVNVSNDGVGGTVQRTSRRGWAAQNQTFSVAGTSATVTVQDSHEAVAGSFANLTGGAFAAVNAGSVGAERIASTTGIIKRYVRVKTTGTFSSAIFASAIWVAVG